MFHSLPIREEGRKTKSNPKVGERKEVYLPLTSEQRTESSRSAICEVSPMINSSTDSDTELGSSPGFGDRMSYREYTVNKINVMRLVIEK